MSIVAAAIEKIHIPKLLSVITDLLLKLNQRTVSEFLYFPKISRFSKIWHFYIKLQNFILCYSKSFRKGYDPKFVKV